MKNFKAFLNTTGLIGGFTAHRDCVDFRNTKGKKFAMLYSDLEEALKLISTQGLSINEEFGGDWSYSENKYREYIKPCLEAVEANTVASNIGSQTRSTVEALELYAAFKLGKLPVIGDDGQLSIKYLAPHHLDAAFSKKREFESFLRRKALSSKSISSYLGAIGSTLSKLVKQPIFSVGDVFEFRDLRSKIEAQPEFADLNAMGQMYQAALNHFEDFLVSLTQPIIDFEKLMLHEQVFEYCILQSLLTKPFTILTGGSGSGKTKLAESLAETLRNADDIENATNSALVPVGADWTDNRNVLGFVNHLREVETAGTDGAPDVKKPVYQTTPVLDLLLEATRPGNKAFPFFLILDEMNLSHVERYFADFLSVMEQKDGAVLRLHGEGPRGDDEYRLPRYEGDETGVPRTLPYPRNLFVIGTVNVDETTYMFSPKVLDRANVIEFEVEDAEIEAFLKKVHEYPEVTKAEPGVAEAFLQLALVARKDAEEEGALEALPPEVSEQVTAHLTALFRILKRGRFEFAYRTANEVVRYLRVSRKLAESESPEALAKWDKGGDEGWQGDLDVQVVQKILPKLHGSIGRMNRLLTELAVYCHDGDAAPAGAAADTADGQEEAPAVEPTIEDVLERDPEKAAFQKSFRKLQAMMETLRDEQFVSFIQ